MDPQQHHDTFRAVKHTADLIAAVAVGGTIIGWLPTIGAVLGILWYIAQLYDWAAAKLKRRKFNKTAQRRKTDVKADQASCS